MVFKFSMRGVMISKFPRGRVMFSKFSKGGHVLQTVLSVTKSLVLSFRTKECFGQAPGVTQ